MSERQEDLHADFAIVKSIESLREFQDYCDGVFRRKRGRFYFRGQSNASWPLSTTFERLLSRVRSKIVNVEPFPRYPSGEIAETTGQRVELLILRAFQARATRFLSRVPDLEDTLEWFSLMRHWRLPSRLLDVTTSPYVALYFAAVGALKNTDKLNVPSAVWAINHVYLRGRSSLEAGFTHHESLSDRARFNRYFLAGSDRPFAAPVHPRTHNERLAAQQGTFLCHTGADSSLMGDIQDCLSREDLLPARAFHKLVVAPQAAVSILARLSAMNIHSASLFPDIAGFVDYIEDNLLLFAADSDQTEPLLDFESLERLGCSG